MHLFDMLIGVEEVSYPTCILEIVFIFLILETGRALALGNHHALRENRSLRFLSLFFQLLSYRFHIRQFHAHGRVVRDLPIMALRALVRVASQPSFEINRALVDLATSLLS